MARLRGYVSDSPVPGPSEQSEENLIRGPSKVPKIIPESRFLTPARPTTFNKLVLNSSSYVEVRVFAIQQLQ